MKNAILYITLFFSLLLSSSSMAEPLGTEQSTAYVQDPQLQKLFDLTLSQNPTIQYAVSQQASALSEQKMMLTLQKPEVHYQGSLGYAWTQNSDFARTANKLEATYPLYEPDKQDLYSAASYRHEASKLQVEEIKQALLLKVSKHYFKYWAQQAELTFLQKEFESISDIMGQVNQRFKVGYQDLNDISDIQARLDRNRADRLKAEQRLAITRLNIEQLVGSSIDWERLKWQEGLPPKLNESTEDSNVEEQIRQHPSLKRLEQDQFASDKQVAYAKNRDGVLVKAFGAYINNQSEGNFYDDMQGFRAGLQLNLPLYQSGRTDAAIAKARAETYQVQAQKRQQRLMITTSLKLAYLSVKSGLKQLEALKEAMRSNEQAVKSAEKGLTTGNRNILDLLDAQRNLHRAERDIQIEKNNIWQSWYLYQWSRGEIS